MADRLGYRPALDGIRGVAILLVIGSHTGWLSTGGLGVDLFFVLSGFLITTLLLEERTMNGAIRLGAFYARRARRLLPALVVMLAAYAAWTAVEGASWQWITQRLVIAITYTSNLVHTAGVDPGLALGHLWSLAQEEQFYLLWPLVLVLLPRARPRWLLVALAAAVVAESFRRGFLAADRASLERLWFGPDTHADSILIGCAAGLARWVGIVRSVPSWIVASSCAVMVGLLVGLHGGEGGSAWFVVASLPAFPLAAAVVLLGLVETPASALARGLGLPPLRELGVISYGVYLWHVPVYTFVTGGLAGTALAVAIAAASYRCVEAPIRRWRPLNAKSPAPEGAGLEQVAARAVG